MCWVICNVNQHSRGSATDRPVQFARSVERPVHVFRSVPTSSACLDAPDELTEANNGGLKGQRHDTRSVTVVSVANEGKVQLHGWQTRPKLVHDPLDLILHTMDVSSHGSRGVHHKTNVHPLGQLIRVNDTADGLQARSVVRAWRRLRNAQINRSFKVLRMNVAGKRLIRRAHMTPTLYADQINEGTRHRVIVQIPPRTSP
mmetsp:Transcript_3987/g.11125  ORF Transcript_3987/g.11125 Transcript_3987/m.11125 type:complete len:201 (+) Transcript_3987:2141-2743(+)